MLLFTPEKLHLRVILRSFLFQLAELLTVLLLLASNVYAEGSKELIANGGTRAVLYSGTATSNGFYFPTEGLVRVYVNAGETIYMGSSGVSSSGDDAEIILVSPSGAVFQNNGSDDGKGNIANATQESNGPSYNGTGGMYQAFTHTATEAGVWSVFFVAGSSITYFDVSVSASATATSISDFITGRAYMNVFAGDLGAYSNTFKGIFYVLTNDGYVYKVNANGLAGYRFTFFSNNKGYKKADGTASYLSENSTSTTNLKDPRTADTFNGDGTANDVTHKLFFNMPAADLPVSASIRYGNGSASDPGTLGTTWLNSTPVLPVISNFSFTGIEGTADKAGTFGLSSYISFNSNQSGTYTITIDVDNNGVDAGDVNLTGNAVAGANTIPWNGKDGSGVAVRGTIGASSIKVAFKAGEVHFPFIDVENNPTGIEITRLGGGPGTTTVYWDDTNIPSSAGPSSPKTQLTGVTSVGAGANGHKWGLSAGGSAYDGNNFGNEVGLDTWAYLLASPIASASPVQLREADLQVVSVVTDKATYCIGDPITYTIKLKNNGPDNVTGAVAAFNYPAEVTLTATPTYVNSNVTIVSSSNTTTQISAVLDMLNQGTLTASIQGIVTAKPVGGTLAASATILRPADVNDPDATNSDSALPTDPQAECDAGTVGCNNIVSQTATVLVSNISIAGTTATITEGNTTGSTKDMTFTVSLSAANTGCPVTVNYDLVHGTTTDADFDFNTFPKSGTLTFATGQTSKVITFKVKQDLMVEANETFTVKLSSPSSGGAITTANATGTVNNDDNISTVTITAVNGKEGTQNGTYTFSFPTGLSFDVDTPIPFTLGTGGSTATGGGTDYTPSATTTITIPAGQNSVLITLAVADDAIAEGTETVEITPGTITNSYSTLTVSTPIPVLSIVDNDVATLSISNVSITEGDSGTQDLTFSVTLNNTTGSNFSVNYATANGTGLAGEDYIAKSGTLNFSGAPEVQTVAVKINGDKKIEANEAFTLVLSSLSNTFGGQLTISGSPATGTITDDDNTVANKVIHITSTDGNELGPTAAVYTLSFPAGVSADKPTTVNFTITGGTATSGADYTGGTVTSVVIPAGSNSATVSLTVVDDAILEDAESVTLTTGTVSNASYSGIVVDNSPQTVLIEDNDFANITIGNASVVEGDNGTVNLVFNVTLDKATGSDFTVGYTVADGTAKTSDNDYITPVSNTLTFTAAGPFPETKQIAVQVKGDQIIEANETFTVTLGTPSNTYNNHLTVTGSSGTSATGTITDDDNTAANKKLTITKVNGFEGVAASKGTFTFSLPTGVTVSSDTEISYTLGGTATGAGTDYTGAAAGTLIIPAGANSVTLGLPVVDDLLLEGDETVIMNVSGVTNASYPGFTVSNSGISLTIVEDDNTVLLSSPQVIVEGNTGTTYARFNASVALATSGPFTVTYRTSDGSAKAGEDYIAQSGTLTFAAGSPGQVQTIDVVINGDLKIESDETFTVTLDNLSNNFGGTLLLSPPVTMTIEDDDNITANKLIAITKTDGSEDGTDGVFTLSFPAGVTADDATTINYSLNGVALGLGTDFTDTSVGTATIPAGRNSVSVNLTVVDDNIIEGPESAVMNVTSTTNPSYPRIGAANSPTSLDILDNDNTAANNVITLTKVADGAEPGTNAQFKVAFPAGLTASVPTIVNYNIAGTAAAGLDYTALSGTVTILQNQNSALIDVSVINDQILEPTETVALTLTNASNAISTLSVAAGAVSVDIADDDNASAANRVITLAKVSDGSEPGSNPQFKVSFPAGITSAVDITVSYTVSGTALAGTDYTALTGSVVIPAGDNSALIDVNVIDDKIIENTETVLLKLAGATSTISTLTVQPGIAVTANIADDDNTIANNTINIARISHGAEPSTNGQFAVSYPPGISSSEDTQVTYTISGTAINGTDYTTLTGTVLIPANTNSVPVNVLVTDDQIIEATETVTLALTAANNVSFSPTVNTTPATLNIIDDDNTAANNKVILSWSADGAEPGTPAQFKLSFPAGYTSSQATVVNYTTAGMATPGADYTALSGTVTIPANTNSVSINAAVADDKIIEGAETVELTLAGATNPIISSIEALPAAAVSAIIQDDDDAVAANNIIALTKTDGAEPGTNARFTVSYPAGFTSSKPTTVTYTVGGSAAAGTDYTAMSGTVVIPANSNSASFDAPVIDDHIIEPTETVEVTVTGASNGISTPTWTSGTITANIADDDNVLANNTITLSRTAHGAEPSTKAQFQVSFPAGYTSSVVTTVSYSVAGSAIPGTDYTTLTGSVEIPANSNSANIDVLVIDDKIIELTETVDLTLSAATNSVSTLAISPSGASVSADITDDDNNSLNNQISLAVVREGTEGGTNPQFVVSFPSGFRSSVPTTVNYSLTSGSTALSGTDFTALSGTVTIPANANSAVIDVPVINDLIIEPTEAVEIQLSSASNSIATAITTQLVATSANIVDDDNTAANNTITLTKVSDGQEPGTNARFQVSYPSGITASEATDVSFNVSGTATSAVDYSALTGTITIPANQNSAFIDVAVIDDHLIEPTETVALTLTSATSSLNGLTVSSSAVSADILDDDDTPANNVIMLSKVNDAGEPGTAARFKVSFPAGISSSVNTIVDCSVTGGTAVAGTDYTAPTGQVTITAGSNEAFIDVNVIDDKIIENTETFTVQLSSAISTISTLTVQPATAISAGIVDDDNTVLNSSITLARTADGSEPSSNGQFTVSYPAGITSSEDTQVTYSVAGSAVNGVDYSTLTGTVTISANSNSAVINVTVTDDKIIESTESVELTLAAASNVSFAPTVNTAMSSVNIADDDNVAANNRITLQWAADGTEPGTPAKFTIGFPAGYTAAAATTINYTVSGTATSGADFTALSGTVTIPANTNSVPVNVAILDDQIIEGTETVALILTGATNNIISSLATFPTTSVSANIEDDEDDLASNNVIALSKTDGAEPGSNARFTVSYPAGITSSHVTTVTYSVGGTAAAGSDYAAMSGTVTIPANSSSATFDAVVIDDQIIEATETVEVTLTGADNGVSTLTWAPASIVADILDNDNISTNNVITLTKVSDGAEPGNYAQFKVSFPAGYTSSVATTVAYTVGGTALPGTDYTTLPGTVIIPANSNSAVIDVVVTDDKIIEPNETVTLTLTSASNSISTLITGPVTPVSVDIADDDNTSANNLITLAKVSDGAEPGSNAHFKVSFPAGYTSSVASNLFYTVSGTALAGTDYTTLSGIVTIPANSNSANIDVAVLDDKIIELTETVALTLTSASNSISNLATAPASAVSANIADNDNIALNTVITLVKVADGAEPGSNPKFRVSYPIGYTSAVATTVTYAVAGGTATAGSDYAAITGTVSIPANTNGADIEVAVVDDKVIEATEAVQLSLTGASSSISATLSVNNAPASADIADDDNTAANRTIIIAKTDGAEGGAAGSFVLSLPAGVTFDKDVTIPFGLSGQASSGADYTASSTGSIILPAGQNSMTITLNITDDAIIEDTETVTIVHGAISSPYGTVAVNPASILTLNIADNDNATVTLSHPAPVTEGASGTTTAISFTVTLNKATTGSFNIDYATANGIALAGEDYAAISGTLHFGGTAGETYTITVPVNGDNEIEADELFTFSLGTPDNTFNNRLAVSGTPATGTILDDDNTAANRTITIAKTDGAEGGAAGTFVLSLPAGVTFDKDVTIPFGLSGQATSGADYTASVSGSITIPAGQNSITLTLNVTDDAIIEDNETVTIVPGAISPYGAVTVNPASILTLNIIDNDNAVLTLSQPAPVIEGGGGTTTAISFTVTLNKATTGSFNVSYTTVDGTATAGEDYVQTTGTLHFGGTAGESYTITVPVNGDGKIEADELFTIALGTPDNTFNNRLGVNGTPVTGTIMDDDNTAASRTITIAKTDGVEGGAAGTFVLSLPAGVTFDKDVSIPFGLSGQASSGADYTASATGSITIPTGQNSVTLTLNVTDDAIIEDTETVTIVPGAISSPYGVVTVNPTSILTLNIADNDNAVLTLSGPASVVEGNTGTASAIFTVRLNKATASSFDISFATADRSATVADNDYVANSGTIHFAGNAGESMPITVLIKGDKKIEQNEILTLLLSNLSNNFANRLSIANPNSTLAIGNDDSAAIVIVPANGAEGRSDASFTFKFGDPDITSDVPVIIAFGVGGTAVNTTLNYDYTATPAIGSITIPANAKTAKLILAINDDRIAEGTESIILNTNIPQSLPYGITISNSPQTANIADNDIAGLSISNATVTEENNGTRNINFTVKLDKATGKPFAVGYTTANSTALAGEDYIAKTALLNFNGTANESKVISIEVNGDRKVETDETFKVSLTTLSDTFDGRLTLDNATAIGTIVNDDAAVITMSRTNGTEGGADGSFTFSLPTGVTLDAPVTLSYELAGTSLGTGQNFDYTALPSANSMVLPAGQQSVQLKLAVNDDQIVEDDETVLLQNVAVNSIYGNLLTVDPTVPALTISDNDQATLTLSGPVDVLENNTGTTTANFTVTLTKATAGSFDLVYNTVDGTAKASDNDYVPAAGSLHFAGNAGESYPISVLINGDKKIEQDEIFRLVLGALTQNFNGRLTVPVASAVTTIKNDDSGSLVIVPIDGAEGGNNASFSFGFTDPDVSSDVPLTISYGLSGTASGSGGDYDYTPTPPSGSITLPANAKSVKLDLAVNDDAIIEGNETVILTTNVPAGLPYGITVSDSPQTLTIADNDQGVLVISGGSITEGNSGLKDLNFTVKLDKATGKPFTVRYVTTDGTARAGEDFVERSGFLNFNGTAGEAQSVAVQVKGDLSIEQNEMFTVELNTLSDNFNTALSIAQPTASGTILDDDITGITVTKVRDGAEGGENARFRVGFAADGVTSTEPIQVQYTVGGTATPGPDYTSLSETVTIPAGASEAFIDVEVTDDILLELTETVAITLTSAKSANFILPVSGTPATADITDNDVAVLNVSNPTVTEGNSGPATLSFNLILSHGLPGGFDVRYDTSDGTATVGDNDYVPASGSIHFDGSAGEMHKVSVTINGDRKIERDETLHLLSKLSTTYNGRLTLNSEIATGTILDDDDIPANKVITITKTDGREGAANGSFTFSFPAGITLDSPTSVPFTIGGTATSGLDFATLFVSPIIIPEGVNSITIPVPVNDDAIVEGPETLQVLPGAVKNSRYTGISITGPVPLLTIFDNDNAVLSISNVTLKEGNVGGTLMKFDVKLSTATHVAFTVDYATQDITATLADKDYSAVSSTFVFAGTAGETQTISVFVNGDIAIEQDETFRVLLSNLSETFGGALRLSNFPGIGTIINDDVQPVAADDVQSTDEDTPVTFAVTGNDLDVDGSIDLKSIAVIAQPIHGILVLNADGTFTYTPDKNYNGTDGFSYTVKDNTGFVSNVAKVTLVVNPVNDIPEALDEEFYVFKNGSITGDVSTNDTDIDGGHLSFTIVTAPANGKITSLNTSTGVFTYAPNQDFVGVDKFTYRVCDPEGGCDIATVTLYVQPKVVVSLRPSATIKEGDVVNFTAEITEPLLQDVAITLNYTGTAEVNKDYTLENQSDKIVIPAGKLTTTQQTTIRTVKDFLKEGDELLQINIQTATPTKFVTIGNGADVLIEDFYPEDIEGGKDANLDINPDPLTSPNGDGIGNERFIIHNIERYPDNEVAIFNRWGNEVYRIKGYNNSDKAFAGIANTGLFANKNAELVDGVYYFIIHTKDKNGVQRTNKGYFIIKR
jgi:hypothetical protein